MGTVESKRRVQDMKKVGISFEPLVLARLDSYAEPRFKGNRSVAVNYLLKGALLKRKRQLWCRVRDLNLPVVNNRVRLTA